MKSAIPSMLLIIMSITILTTSFAAYAQNGDVGVSTTANENGAATPDGVSALDAVTPDGTWHRFQFLDTGSFGTAGGGCPGATYICAPDPPWTFDCPDTGLICWLTVTDGFELGDEFEVFDFGSSVGTTSIVSPDGSCSDDPDACLAAGFSSAMIDLGSGAHSITIQVTDSPFAGGAAFFKIDIHPPTVGGVFEGVDTAALLVAGAQVNAYWILPVIAAISIAVVLARKRF